MGKYITKSAKQTQKMGEELAKEILVLRQAQAKNKSAVVFGLQGNLGGGKTTFLQGFAKGLGIKEKILSPTFVILKRFKITGYGIQNIESRINSKVKIQNSKFTDFYHIDCYRLENAKEILGLDFKEIISDPKNIVAIEWPEKIKRVLPKDTIFIKFKFIKEKIREINFKI